MLPDIPPPLPAPGSAFAGPDAGGLDDPLGLNGLLADRNSLGGAPDVIDHFRAVAAQASTLATTAALPDPDGARAGRSGPAAAAAGAPAGDAREPRPPGPQDRKVLVFEPTSGGLLTLLAHSAVSDLAQLSATVRVSTATSPGQGTAMLAAEPFRCVVVDLGMPKRPGVPRPGSGEA